MVGGDLMVHEPSATQSEDAEWTLVECLHSHPNRKRLKDEPPNPAYVHMAHSHAVQGA